MVGKNVGIHVGSRLGENIVNMLRDGSSPLVRTVSLILLLGMTEFRCASNCLAGLKNALAENILWEKQQDLLRIIYPGGHSVTTTLDWDPGLNKRWKISAETYAEVLRTMEARVVRASTYSTVILYTIVPHKDGPRSKLGIAVIDRGALIWRKEVTSAFGSGGGGPHVLEEIMLRRSGPRGLRLSFRYTTNQGTPRQYYHALFLFQRMEKEMIELLHDEMPVDSWRQPANVMFKREGFDDRGWREFSLSAVEDGGPHASNYMSEEDMVHSFKEQLSPEGLRVEIYRIVYEGGKYKKSRINDRRTSRKITFAVAIQQYDSGNWYDPLQLYPCLSLSTSEYLVHRAENWRGEDDFAVRLYAGSLADDLIVLFKVTDRKLVLPSLVGSLRHRDVERQVMRSDHCELWLWGREREVMVQIGLSPGNFLDLLPFTYQWLPESTVDVPGIQVKSRRTAQGYDLLARISADFLKKQRLWFRNSFVCLSVLNVRNSKDAEQDCMLSSAEGYRWNDPTTFNPIKITCRGSGTFRGRIEDINKDAGVITVRNSCDEVDVFTVDEALKSRSRNAITLAELHQGDLVSGKFSGPRYKMVAEYLKLQSQPIQGVFDRIVADSRSFSLRLDGGTLRQFPIVGDIEVKGRGSRINLSMDFLANGDRVTVVYGGSEANPRVLNVILHAQMVEGIIASISKEQFTLRLNLKKGGHKDFLFSERTIVGGFAIGGTSGMSRWVERDMDSLRPGDTIHAEALRSGRLPLLTRITVH